MQIKWTFQIHPAILTNILNRYVILIKTSNICRSDSLINKYLISNVVWLELDMTNHCLILIRSRCSVWIVCNINRSKYYLCLYVLTKLKEWNAMYESTSFVLWQFSITLSDSWMIFRINRINQCIEYCDNVDKYIAVSSCLTLTHMSSKVQLYWFFAHYFKWELNVTGGCRKNVCTAAKSFLDFKRDVVFTNSTKSISKSRL